MFKKYLTSLVIILISISFNIGAKDIVAQTVDWAPYYSSKLKDGGVYTDLVTAAFKAVGHNYSVEFIPWKRALDNGNKGKIDAVQGAYTNEERQKIYHFSDIVMSSEVSVITHSSQKNFKYNGLSDLKGKQVGILRGSTLGQDFENIKKSMRIKEFNTVKDLAKAIVNNKVFSVIESKYTFLDAVNQMNEKLEKISIKNPAVSRENIYMIFPKARPDSEKIKDDFNRGLKMIKDNGEFDKIIKKHNFSL